MAFAARIDFAKSSAAGAVITSAFDEGIAEISYPEIAVIRARSLGRTQA